MARNPLSDSQAFSILGIPQQGATLESISKAYRAMARRFHPDLNPGVDTTKQMAQLNNANDAAKLYVTKRDMPESNRREEPKSPPPRSSPRPSYQGPPTNRITFEQATQGLDLHGTTWLLATPVADVGSYSGDESSLYHRFSILYGTRNGQNCVMYVVRIERSSYMSASTDKFYSGIFWFPAKTELPSKKLVLASIKDMIAYLSKELPSTIDRYKYSNKVVVLKDTKLESRVDSNLFTNLQALQKVSLDDALLQIGAISPADIKKKKVSPGFEKIFISRDRQIITDPSGVNGRKVKDTLLARIGENGTPVKIPFSRYLGPFFIESGWNDVDKVKRKYKVLVLKLLAQSAGLARESHLQEVIQSKIEVLLQKGYRDSQVNFSRSNFDMDF